MAKIDSMCKMGVNIYINNMKEIMSKNEYRDKFLDYCKKIVNKVINKNK